MQPVHPSLPRSNTIGNLGQSSPLTPSFMRPTTSSARRSSAIGRSNTAVPSSMTGRGSVAVQRQRKTSLRNIAGSNTSSKTPTQAHQVGADTIPARSDSLVSAPSMVDELAPALEWETGVKQPDMPADYSDGANFQIIDQHAPEMPPIAKESNNGKPKAPADHVHETRRFPQPKDCKKGILKSKNENRKLSDGLSNLYVDDEVETSKEKYDDDEIKPRSDRGTPNYSERTASPESSNPRLVRIFPPLNLIPLHPFLVTWEPPSSFPPRRSQLMHHHRQIHEAQPPMWWLGRYTALSDRFRTGALPSPPSSPSRFQSSTNDFSSTNEPSETGLTSASSSNANHPMHDTDRRNRRVYIHLRSLCTTDEARASLDEFKGIMEAREKKMTAGPQGKAVKEKQGWLEGLMGKKKKGDK